MKKIITSAVMATMFISVANSASPKQRACEATGKMWVDGVCVDAPRAPSTGWKADMDSEKLVEIKANIMKSTGLSISEILAKCSESDSNQKFPSGLNTGGHCWCSVTTSGGTISSTHIQDYYAYFERIKQKVSPDRVAEVSEKLGSPDKLCQQSCLDDCIKEVRYFDDGLLDQKFKNLKEVNNIKNKS